MTNMKAFMAFHSTTLDKEVTAANYAGICTSSVIKEKHIDRSWDAQVTPLPVPLVETDDLHLSFRKYLFTCI